MRISVLFFLFFVQAVQSVAHYRGAVTESSNDSLASSSSIGSTRESASATGSGSGIGNGTETLPCVNREVHFKIFKTH